MSKYSAQKASAFNLISRKGQQVTVYRTKLVANYDPLNPAASVPTVDTSAQGVAVVLPATTSTIGQFDATEVDPQRVVNYRYLILAGFNDIKINDIVRTKTGDLQVRGVRFLDPDGGGAILWQVIATTDTNIQIPA